MFDDAPWWLVALGGAFVLFVTGLIVTSLHRPTPAVYRPTRPGATPQRDSIGARIVTLDARSPDGWTYFDFSRGTVVQDSSVGWDLAARRFHLIVNGGAGLGGGAALQVAESDSFGGITETPTDGWTGTAHDGNELVHPLLKEWYRYDFFSHLLRPRRRTYLLRTRSGRVVKLQFLGYYCPGPEGGCPTFRYDHLDGSPETSGNRSRSNARGRETE